MRSILSKFLDTNSSTGREKMSDVVADAHDMIVDIAKPRRGESRDDIAERVFKEIRKTGPAYKAWTERRCRSLFSRDVEAHQIRALELLDLEDTRLRLKGKIDAAAANLIQLRDSLHATDPLFHREHIMAIDATLAEMGYRDLSGIQAED